jgi:hypothetical protein
MFKFVYPQKDTFVSNHPDLKFRNFGKDEILEIGKRDTPDCTKFIARSLLKFDLSSISSSIASGEITNPEFYLRLYTVDAYELPLNYSIIARPVSQSWEPGTGRLFDDDTIKGASWKYRDDFGGKLWDVSQSPTSSAGGGNWYDLITSQSISAPSANITFTNYDQNQEFFVTSSDGLIYTFQASSSTQVSQSGFASAAVPITAINNFDQFVISASHECRVIAIANNTPADCDHTYYFGWSGSNSQPIEASASILIQDISEGDTFEIVDFETTHSLMASSNPNVVSPDCSNLSFFYIGGSTWDSVISMSHAINSISNFYITASVSASFSASFSQSYSSSISASVTQSFTQSFTLYATSSYLVLNSQYAGESGNSFYIWNKGETIVSSSFNKCGDPQTTTFPVYQKLTGGKYTGFKTKFDLFVAKLNAISQSCGFTFNATKDFVLHLTASVSGTLGNSYYFQSGSTISTFGGAVASSSISVNPADTINRKFYFITGSSLNDTIDNLSNEINNWVSFISTSTSASVMTVIATDDYLQSQNIGIQSGSYQVKLSGAVSSTAISSSVYQEFNNVSSDLNMNVTPIVNSWLNGNTPNEGIILLSSEEDTDIPFGGIKYFSHNTNTIYSPTLVVKYDDSSRNTGSLTATSDNKLKVGISNLKQEYTEGEKIRLKVFARDEFPQKTFNNKATRYTDTQFLPETSYYAIQDASTDEYLIDFDDKYTKLSVDADGNYFILDTSNFPQERFFRIFIKVVQNNTTQIFKENKAFKVVV